MFEDFLVLVGVIKDAVCLFTVPAGSSTFLVAVRVCKAEITNSRKKLKKNVSTGHTKFQIVDRIQLYVASTVLTSV